MASDTQATASLSRACARAALWIAMQPIKTNKPFFILQISVVF